MISLPGQAEHGEYLRLHTREEVIAHAKNIPANLAHLASLVLECLENGYWKDNAKFGLNHLSTLVSISLVYGNDLKTVFFLLQSEAQFKLRNGLGLRKRLGASNNGIKTCNAPNVAVPNKFNWNELNLVTPVKDQGACSDCYVFAATAAMESQVLMKMMNYKNDSKPVAKSDFQLSEQDELNCSDGGCGGGWPSEVYRDFETRGAVEWDHHTRYQGRVSPSLNIDYRTLKRCFLSQGNEM